VTEYTVYRRMTGTQAYVVDARSKADARRKVLAGDAEAVDFWITNASDTMLAYPAGEWDPIAEVRGAEDALPRA
jgi:hypothetical protein